MSKARHEYLVLSFVAVCEGIIFGSFRLPSSAQPQFVMAKVWHGGEQSFHIHFGIVLVTPRRVATLIPH